MSYDLSAVPTTRLMQKTTFVAPRGVADEKRDAELVSLSKVVREACSKAVQSGKLGKPGSTVSLPVSETGRLATLVRDAKLANWTTQAEQVAGSPPSALLEVVECSKKLEDVFSALLQVEIPKESPVENDLVETTVLTNVEAGLQLACVHFDSVAGCGPLTDRGEDCGGDHAVLQFVSHVVRSVFSNQGVPCAISSSALPLVSALAAFWQSAHHAIAAAKYEATPLARRVIPLTARCLAGIPQATSRQGVPKSLSAVAAAALDLLTAALGQGEEAIQSLAVEELAGGQNPVRTASRNAGGGGGDSADGPQPGKGSGKSRRRETRLSAQTAALVRAVSAACLPAEISDIGGQLPTKELQDIVMARRSLAEERADTLVTGTLRRCLLGAERDSPQWFLLEGLTRELLDHCADPELPAAPLVLLTLAKGLTAVAGASRSVEMSWTQREFAVRLLGMIAAKLCQECAATDVGDASDLLEMQRWSEAFDNGARALQVHWRCAEGRRSELAEENVRDAEEVWRLLVQFLETRPASVKVLWAPDSKDKTLKNAVLPVDHTVWNSTYLLASCAAQSCQESSCTRPAASRRADKGKASRAASNRAVAAFRSTEGGQDATAACWALSAWSSRASANDFLAVAGNSGRKGIRQRAAVELHAKRLYRRQVFHGADAELGKARRLALEALLGQLKSSPLVFVRRQAVHGLANACSFEIDLVKSRCMNEAIKLGLTDDSGLVRSAVIDFIGRLVSGDAKGLDPQNASQLRAAVRTRLGDIAPGVRRAAFRVACDALCPKDPTLMVSATDLMQRIQHEAPRVRDPVLCALERVLLAQPLAEEVLDRLATLSANVSIGGAGLRDLFKAHRTARTPDIFAQSMNSLAARAYENIQSRAESPATECPSAVPTILEQIALEYPAAVFTHIEGVQSWLDIAVETAPAREVLLAQHACRILADVLPAWAAEADVSERTRFGHSLQKLFTPLLAAETSTLTRGAMETLSITATHVTGDPKTVLKHVSDSFQYLSEIVNSRSALDAAGQRLLCRHALILGTALEFLDVDALLLAANDAEREALQLPEATATKVHLIVSALCLKGPATLRPSLTNCLGFILRRHMKFLESSPGPLDVFRNALINADGPAMRARAMEVLAGLLGAYQHAAETGTPPGGIQNEAVAKALLAPKVSEAVQRLATLQPQILEALAQADSAMVADHAIEVLGSFSRLGVLHPSPAMSSLIASSMAGFQEVAGAAGRLIFKLAEASPQLLLNRLGSGLREAAAHLKTAGQEPGSLLRETWRFTALTELCSEQFESKRLREMFLDAVLTEVAALSNTPDDTGAKLQRAELLVGLLAGLPYRCEFEIAQLLKCAVRFLTLQALPFLIEGGSQIVSGENANMLGICAASMLLHSLCQHLCTPGEIQRLLSEAEADRALPPGFSRRVRLEFFVPMLRELAAVADDCPMLCNVLEDHVPVDSVLMKGACRAAQQSTGKQGAGRGSSAHGQGQKRTGRGRPRRALAAMDRDLNEDEKENMDQGANGPPTKRRCIQASRREDGGVLKATVEGVALAGA